MRAGRPGFVGAAPIALDPDAGVDSAIAAVLAAARDHWVANEPAVRATGQVRAVHQLRVGLRRFRSALSLFKNFLPKPQRQWLNGEAKWLLSEFGPTRDLDVLCEELIPVAESSGHRRAFKELRAVGVKSRRAAFAVAVKSLRSPRYGRFLRRLDTWLAGAGWRAARDEKVRDGGKTRAVDFAERAIEKRILKILARGKSMNRMSATDRHSIRIAVKKCRYSIEFFAAVLPKHDTRTLARRLKSLQDSLGHANDVDVARHTIDDLGSAASAPAAKHALEIAGRALIAHHRRLEKNALPAAARHWQSLRATVL